MSNTIEIVQREAEYYLLLYRYY